MKVLQDWENLGEDFISRGGGWSLTTEGGVFFNSGCGRDARPTWMTEEPVGSAGQTRADIPVWGSQPKEREWQRKSA